MPIDFNDRYNQHIYSFRDAPAEWIQLLTKYVDFKEKDVVDMGCGGGIYAKVLSGYGAKSVMCLDSSKNILDSARENCKNFANIDFKIADAVNTGLNSRSYDVVLQRALIHHIRNLDDCFKEANRVLKSDGVLIIQDRTPDDCLIEGSPENIRGYFFEIFPKLSEIETSRRYASERVCETLKSNEFSNIQEVQFWETRRIYDDFESLAIDLRCRKGRSILFELNDNEINELIVYIKPRFNDFPICEKDKWTMWIAKKLF